jgi:hypothetical protein
MNCCDYDCNQGRDCPARTAKVGQRYPRHPEPLCIPARHEHLRELARAMLLTIVAMLLGASLVLWGLYA